MTRIGLVGMGLAALALAGCADGDGGFGDVSASEEFARMIDANAAMTDRVEDLPVASAAEMPLSGGASYDGYATIVMGDGIETSLVGDAEIDANFRAGTITGELDDFVGQVDGASPRELEGELRITDGDIGVATASEFGANLDGVLRGGGDRVAVDGSIIGNFRTDGARDASALTAVTAGGTDFTLNGDEQPGLMSIVAER